MVVKILISKKAMAMGQLVVIILVIVSFTLIAGTVTRAFAKVQDKDAELLCQNSVALRMSTVVNVNQEQEDEEYFDVVKASIKPIPMLCRTIDVKVKGDKEKVMKTIAEKMATCWKMFGEGRFEKTLDESKVKVLPTLFALEETKNKCFNCYTILVEELEDGEIRPEEFMQFLIEEKYSKTGEKYADYVQGHGGPGRIAYLVIRDGTQQAGSIREGYAYAISFAPKLSAAEGGISASTAAKAAGAGGLVAIGILAATPPGWVALGIAGIAAVLGTSTLTDIYNAVAAMYGERDVSSVYFDTLESAQQHCGSKDIAGE